MFCNKCGKEISESSVFCNFCGHEVENDTQQKEIIKEKIVQTEKDESSKKNNKVILGVILTVITLVLATIFAVSSNPINSAFKAFNNNEYDKMLEVYENDIKGNKEKQKEFTEKVKLEAENIESNFELNKIIYEEAIDKLDELYKLRILTNNINEAKKNITKLNDSRVSFENAKEFEKNKKYIEAITAYNKVISDDRKNYDEAKIRIEDLLEGYKSEVLVKIEEYSKNEDYKNALSIIMEAINILPKDDDIKDKKAVYDTLLGEQLANAKKEMLEKARADQLITVEKTSILIQDTRHKTLYPDMFSVIIKNNSDKTIKSYSVSMLGWDKNGYPLKIKQSFLDSSGSYEFLGGADNVNVIKDGTYGKNSGWKLEDPHNIVKTKAVVIEAEFYDGSNWENDYYKYFLEEFEGKQLLE